ncbi:MAG TPA: hypothetical protein VHA78_00390 [Candidatus Peribacteraceae bacterium]|nr:hypothetical protein [Candidatus Peribacteraceae bacterium]
MSAESFTVVDLDPKPDSLPDETVDSWLGNTVGVAGKNSDATLEDLHIDHASHPAFHDLTYLFNKEAMLPVSTEELWTNVGCAHATIKEVRKTARYLLTITPE